MHTKYKSILILLMSLLLHSNSSYAKDEQTLIYEDITGVTLEMSEDASTWIKIRSVGESALRFGDRQDVILSTKKATLAAKAEIAKFLNERVSTQDSISDITKVLTEKNGLQAEIATRKSVETLSTEINNSAEEILKGVLTLEQKVDTKNGLVKVTVGMSRKTIGASNSIKASLNNNEVEPTAVPKESINDSAQIVDEIKRSKNYDNF